MTVVPFQDADAQREAAPAIARHLDGGGLIAYPTETMYGFGCAVQSGPVAALMGLKQRDETKPFLLLVADGTQVDGLVWNDAARALAAAFWPGPLTIAMRAEPGVYPSGIDADGVVAVRATSHGGVRILLDALGAPVTSTSANAPGRAPATSAAEAADALAALDATDAFWVLDGGVLPASPPSTLVDCSADRPRVLRRGAVPVEQLRAVLKEIDV